MELSCKHCLTNYFLSLCIHLSCKRQLWTYFSSFCMDLSRKSRLSKLFLKLLFGTVAQKLSCQATSRGKVSIGIRGKCNVLLSNGRGLGRSLSYVGRSGIRLFMMLHGSVMHKLPFAAASEAFAWNRRAKVAFQSYLAAFAWNCRAKGASQALACNCCAKAALQNYFLRFCVELSCKSCVAKLFLNLLRGAVLQKLPF